MIKNPKISVVVPVFNSEKYLAKCIDSIINQSYHNLEIILINDGSTDSSGEILDRYSQKDNRIIVKHKLNGGIGSAYNTAFELVSGDYVSFVDSDDFISLEMYEELLDFVDAQDSNDIDIVQFGIEYLNPSNESITTHSSGNSLVRGKEYIIQKYITEVSRSEQTPSLGVRLFRRYLFDGFFFPIQSQGIDEIATLFAMLRCKSILFSDKNYYHCVMYPKSISRRAIERNKLFEQTEVYRTIIKFLEKEMPGLVDYIVVKYMKYILLYYPKIKFIENEKKNEVLSYLKQEYSRLYFQIKKSTIYKNENCKMRLAASLFSNAPSLYCLIYKVVRLISFDNGS